MSTVATSSSAVPHALATRQESESNYLFGNTADNGSQETGQATGEALAPTHTPFANDNNNGIRNASSASINNINNNPTTSSATYGLVKKLHTPSKITDFQVTLIGERRVFLPGQPVEGVVSFQLHKKLAIEKLVVNLSGTIRTFESKRKARAAAAGQTPSAGTSFTGMSDVSIFAESVLLAGSEDSHDHHHHHNRQHTILEPGSHSFPFRFQLPNRHLPASFDGEYGQIAYSLRAFLIRSEGIHKKMAKSHLGLTVPSTVNPHTDMFQLPVEVQNTISDRFLPRLRTGNIEVHARIAKKAYIPEETMVLTLDVRNHSASGVLLFGLKMEQHITYVCSNETKPPQVERVHKIPFCEYIPPGVREIERDLDITIPPSYLLSPSSKTPLIQVEHFLILSVAPVKESSSLLKKLGRHLRQQHCLIHGCRRRDDHHHHHCLHHYRSKKSMTGTPLPGGDVPQEEIDLHRPSLQLETSNKENGGNNNSAPGSQVSSPTPSDDDVSIGDAAEQMVQPEPPGYLPGHIPKRVGFLTRSMSLRVPFVIAGFPDSVGADETAEALPMYCTEANCATELQRQQLALEGQNELISDESAVTVVPVSVDIKAAVAAEEARPLTPPEIHVTPSTLDEGEPSTLVVPTTSSRPSFSSSISSSSQGPVSVSQLSRWRYYSAPAHNFYAASDAPSFETDTVFLSSGGVSERDADSVSLRADGSRGPSRSVSRRQSLDDIDTLNSGVASLSTSPSGHGHSKFLSPKDLHSKLVGRIHDVFHKHQHQNPPAQNNQ